jgi:hypothetical protein
MLYAPPIVFGDVSELCLAYYDTSLQFVQISQVIFVDEPMPI